MEADKNLVRDSLLAWDRLLDEYRLPAWDNFPVLPLYMDQVVYLLNQYLSPLPKEAEQKPVTPAMVNNYVKLGIIPRPVKKRYDRAHLAYLLMVCLLKQTISTSEIKKLVPADLDEREIRARYEAFSDVFSGCRQAFRAHARQDAASVLGDSSQSVSEFVFQAALTSGLWQILAEQMLTLYPEADAKDR